MKKIMIIGGGPGGYVAAIKAAQMGAEVHIAEKDKLGGTCLNIGCIPTKALLHVSEFYEKVKSGSVSGVKVNDVTLNWTEAQAEKTRITERLVSGVEGLLKANKVHVHHAGAKLVSENSVEIEGEGVLTVDHIILASGSAPVRPSFTGADLVQVIDSTQALSLASVPQSITIIGGGVIGVEFASLFRGLGTEVTIVEMMEEILPPVDRQVSELMHKLLAEQGVKILVEAKLISVKEKKEKEVVAEVETKDGKEMLESELVLVAVGRKPRITDLGLETVGVHTENGAIQVDENFETNLKGIYAIGDCNAKLMLAHVASAQGEAVVEHIFHGRHYYNRGVLPSCVYTTPEIAVVGITEEQAIKQRANYRCSVFSLAGNGKSMIEGATTGFIKIIADADTGEMLGAHMIGPRVTDMIAELAVVMSMEGVAEDLVRTVHAHPTVSEAVCEAAMGVFGNPIHWPPRR